MRMIDSFGECVGATPVHRACDVRESLAAPPTVPAQTARIA
jgi:hypothetical protein